MRGRPQYSNHCLHFISKPLNLNMQYREIKRREFDTLYFSRKLTYTDNEEVLIWLHNFTKMVAPCIIITVPYTSRLISTHSSIHRTRLVVTLTKANISIYYYHVSNLASYPQFEKLIYHQLASLTTISMR